MTGFNENLKDSAPLTSISEKNDEEAEDSTSNLPAVLREEPGASWMNKKADEEAKRALEFVVDKDFSLSTFIRKSFLLRYLARTGLSSTLRFTNGFLVIGEFGDPFDDRGVSRWKTK